jgi:SAM-dependent methyltransferase
MDTKKYWLNPGEGNEPKDYWKHIERSEFLHKFIDGVIPKETGIVELGCNCGRNVSYLNERGYDVVGFDMNPRAIEFNKGLPIFCKSIEDFFRMGVVDEMYFTMAVLEHLPEESEWVFKEMAKAKYVLTIEDEKSDNGVCFPRNYKNIFEGLGMKELKHETNDDFFVTRFEARLFVSSN